MSFGSSPTAPGAATTYGLFRAVASAWGLLSAAIIVAVAAYIGALNPRIEQPGEWFARSGALVTVLAIFAELVIAKMFARMHVGIQPKVRWLVYPRSIAFIVIVIGTFVWGYGDLLYYSLSSHSM